MTRYTRQLMLPEIGELGQVKLAAAHILVVGAGGLAAPVLPLLAGAGVGRLTLIDGDTVSLSNLHRQTLFTEADCGRSKARVAAARCRAINPSIEVDVFDYSLTPANAPAFVRAADVILDCADSYAVSYMLSDLCLAQEKPLISASVLGLKGYVGGFCSAAPSLRAVFPDAPESGASCATAGVLGPVVGLLGALQAQMALHVVLGLEPSPLGQLVQYDGHSFSTSGFRFDTAQEPETPLKFVASSDLTEMDCIFDLRDPSEGALLHSAARHIAADAVKTNLPTPATRLALCCATGLRAWRAGETLHPHWPGEIVLVAASAS